MYWATSATSSSVASCIQAGTVRRGILVTGLTGVCGRYESCWNLTLGFEDPLALNEPDLFFADGSCLCLSFSFTVLAGTSSIVSVGS